MVGSLFNTIPTPDATFVRILLRMQQIVNDVDEVKSIQILIIFAFVMEIKYS